MMRTHAPSTLCSPFDADAQRVPIAARCAHQDVIDTQLEARRPVVADVDALSPPLGLASPPKSKGARIKRRVLRPVALRNALSPAELREAQEEQACNRLVRAWMSKAQRNDLRLLLHGVPALDRDRFSELASFAMASAAPNRPGTEAWALIETLGAYEPHDMLAVLDFSHDVHVCRVALHKQIQIFKALQDVTPGQRANLWACARTLCGSHRRTAHNPVLLRQLGKLPAALWPHFVTLCTPVLQQAWMPRATRLKTVLTLTELLNATHMRQELTQLHARRDSDVRMIVAGQTADIAEQTRDAAPSTLAMRTRPATPSWYADVMQIDEASSTPSTPSTPPDTVLPGAQAVQLRVRNRSYDDENVMSDARIRPTKTAILQLQSRVACTLPTPAVLALIEAFVINLKQAPDDAGGYLRRHRVVKPHPKSLRRGLHDYSELENALFALNNTYAPSDTQRHAALIALLQQDDLGGADLQDDGHDADDADDGPFLPIFGSDYDDSDDELSDDELALLGPHPDVCANYPYYLNGSQTIGIGDLAALVWNAIDAWSDAHLDSEALAARKQRLRLDFVVHLADCVEDDGGRVCPVGMAERLIACVLVEYDITVPFATPQEVLTVCAQEFAEAFDPSSHNVDQNIADFYARTMRHGAKIFKGDAPAYKLFTDHLKIYLSLEFTWEPPQGANDFADAQLG